VLSGDSSYDTGYVTPRSAVVENDDCNDRHGIINLKSPFIEVKSRPDLHSSPVLLHLDLIKITWTYRLMTWTFAKLLR